MTDNETNKNDKPVKLISLISGGIDSPVATYLMLERGAEVVALYYDNRPFTDEKTRLKTVDLVNQLRKVTKKKIKFIIVPNGNNQKLFARNCDRHVGCVLCRRMMLRMAEEVAKVERAEGLITGDSLGQVASQTLQNLNVESSVIKLPIIRPLIGLDKLEIEQIAQKIGTFDISIGPGLCCTMVPNKPSTNAQLARIENEENKVDLETMMAESLAGQEIIQ
jgi:thiamine biosynthesis protein ThiI